MEANEIITGIEHFFRNLLPKAYFSVEWDETSITNAFHWAEFCEQIHDNYVDKPSKNKLDELIHSIGLNFNDVNICFEDLKKSTNMLCEAFFENPSVENYKIESLSIKIRSDKSSFENIKRAPELDLLCIKLLESLKPIKIADSERSFYHEVKAEIYLNVLQDATQYMNSEDQVEKYLSSSLEELCKSPDEMVLFLHAIIIKLPDETSTKAIQDFAINWLMYKIMSGEHCRLSLYIWEQPSRPRAVALNNFDFLSFYLDFLTKCSSSLICEVKDGEMIWTQRPAERKTLSFHEILAHFRCLLQYDDNIGDFTKRHIVDILNTYPELTVWKEIYSRVT